MEVNTGDEMGVAVYPITNCPHFKEEWGEQMKIELSKKRNKFCQQECIDCHNVGENWVCLVCQYVFCSRYVKEHMVKHNEATKHSVALSFSDGSFWCYECDYYITNSYLDKLRKLFAEVKFKDEKELEKLFEALELKETDKKENEEAKNEEEKNEEKKTEQEEEEIEFTEENLVNGIKEGKFKSIGLLTGAGISVSAGIPDFRTPGTGLYSQLQQYNLPYPEAIFQIDFFRKNPKPFYTLAKEFLSCGVKPTLTHYFIAELDKKNILGINMSQNIDGLELDAGVRSKNLVQAHGHFRTAHCIKCKKEHDMKVFQENVDKDEILVCECGSYVKPDIVFFGEALPLSFMQGIQVLKNCDLVIIMGTSLLVQPFASLVELVPEKVPIVLMNMENSLFTKENFLFLQGDLDTTSKRLMEKLGWDIPKVEKVEVKVKSQVQEKEEEEEEEEGKTDENKK